MNDKDWIAYIPYYGDNIINDFNLKESEHIKLWNIKENKDINHLHYHYSELIVAYSIWKHQVKHDYICLWDHRRFLTPINFDKLDKNYVQVYYHAYTELTPFEYMIHEGINEYIIWQFIKYMIEEKNIEHDTIIDLIFNKSWEDRLWLHSCFNCNWNVFNDLCNFMFNFLNYIMPNGDCSSKGDCDKFINNMIKSESYIRSICKENKIIEAGRIESRDRPFANMFEMLLPLYCELVEYKTFVEFDNKKIGIEINEFNKDTILDDLKKLISKNVFSGCRSYYIKTNNNELKNIVNNNWYYIFHAPIIVDIKFPDDIIQIQMNEYVDINSPVSINYNIKTLDDIKVGIVVAGRLENRYAIEFVEYYKKLGVDNIHIIDNNRNNEEHFEEVLQKYINNKFVIIHNYRYIESYVQYKAYIDLYYELKDKYDWLFFCDFDEYLTLTKDKTIKEYLSRKCFKDYNQILINWKTYTDNNLIYDDGRPCLERFTIPMDKNKCVDDEFPKNKVVKSLIRTKLNDVALYTVHIFINDILQKTTCNNRGTKVKILTYYQPINYDYAYLKHFSTKTIDEFITNKYIRGTGDRSYKDFLTSYTIDMFFKFNNVTIEKLNYLKEHNIEYDKKYDNMIKDVKNIKTFDNEL